MVVHFLIRNRNFPPPSVQRFVGNWTFLLHPKLERLLWEVVSCGFRKDDCTVKISNLEGFNTDVDSSVLVTKDLYTVVITAHFSPWPFPAVQIEREESLEFQTLSPELNVPLFQYVQGCTSTSRDIAVELIYKTWGYSNSNDTRAV